MPSSAQTAVMSKDLVASVMTALQRHVEATPEGPASVLPHGKPLLKMKTSILDLGVFAKAKPSILTSS